MGKARKMLCLLLCFMMVVLSACGQGAETGKDADSSNVESSATDSTGDSSIDASKDATEDGAGNAEDVWVPKEAPAVRGENPDEEKREKETAILEQGTFLFEGETDKGYYPGDISWLTSAKEADAVAIRYLCDDLSHAGWGVLGLAVNGGKGNKQIDIPAGSEPDKERMVIYTVKELLDLAGCTSPSEFTAFSLGAWNGGHITGLYFLPESQVEAMNTYWAEVADTEQIIHTYTGELSNERAGAEAQQLYDYLQETYGEACLTGQMESTWMGSPDYEMNYIKENTGKLPAVRGLDFMHNDFDGVAQRSIDWWEQGGIVTICWHTGAGFNSGYNECLADDINWDEAFTPGSETYNALVAGMDNAVPALQKLEDAGVPVLWRPFHELDGGWFWWSKGGADNFIQLWQMMYSRYTDYWELDNLIWVYGYSGNGGEMADWYPGDDYVDIMGADSYAGDAAGKLYEECDSINPDGMPLIFHECGTIPTEQEMMDQGAPWLMFMVWHTDYITDTSKGNTKERINEIYNSDYFITLDELPEF